MNLTIFAFGGGRSWSEWLSEPVRSISRKEDFPRPTWYEGTGRFLALIHLGTSLTDGDGQKAMDIDSSWQQLPDECRDRVWWLFYSGSGYNYLTSAKPNIHYLRYLVSDSIHSDVASCFTNFLADLASDRGVSHVDLWKKLYPSDNIAAATLLALLSAHNHINDFPAVVNNLVNDQARLAAAHREYVGRLNHGDQHQPSSLEDWMQWLRDGKYDRLRQQLAVVLGSVPD